MKLIATRHVAVGSVHKRTSATSYETMATIQLENCIVGVKLTCLVPHSHNFVIVPTFILSCWLCCTSQHEQVGTNTWSVCKGKMIICGLVFFFPCIYCIFGLVNKSLFNHSIQHTESREEIHASYPVGERKWKRPERGFHPSKTGEDNCNFKMLDV